MERPAQVVNRFADVRFTGLEEVSIRNRTSNAPAQAVRLFPDGTFDAYAPLEEGENELEITAYVDGAPPLIETRTVFFERPKRVGEAQRQAAKALLLQLDYRTAELELLDEMRRTRGAGGRHELDLDVEREAGGG